MARRPRHHALVHMLWLQHQDNINLPVFASNPNHSPTNALYCVGQCRNEKTITPSTKQTIRIFCSSSHSYSVMLLKQGNLNVGKLWSPLPTSSHLHPCKSALQISDFIATCCPSFGHRKATALIFCFTNGFHRGVCSF